MNADNTDIMYLFPPDTKIINFTGSPDKYTALLRSKCKSKEEFRQNWLKQYEKLSKVAMRVLLTRPKTGKTVVYKAAFRCQHNTYPASHQRVKAPHKKHTGCPAVLKVTIKASPENRRMRSIDTLRREYPTIISINHDHNHRLTDQALPIQEFYSNFRSNLSKLSCDTVRNSWADSKTINEKLEGKELDWDSLKKCWNLFMEKWESANSVHLYRAFLRATNFLETCNTVNGTIAALNSIGKEFINRKYGPKVLIQPGSSVMNCHDLSKRSFSNKLEISSAVDELLVIDQGWIA